MKTRPWKHAICSAPLALLLWSYLGTAPSAQAQQWLPLGPNDYNWPSSEPVTFISLALNASGNPVVAYPDGA
ncbi:MAG TPA: hypothetical protein PLL18_12310, partial [Flavobacteriales bacterium]|nr:hypothetical protein [Flavobacteriales bacterium]